MTKAITCMQINRLNQKRHFSSPEPKANRWAYSILMVRRPSIRPSSSSPSVVVVQNAQRSSLLKQLGQSKPPWVGGTNVYLRHSRSHDQDGPTSIYGKNPSKILSRTGVPISTKLGM